MALSKTVVLVHGWSVHDTETYGGLPVRLRHLGYAVEHVWLSRYVSFQDEVRLDDLARAFEAAYRRDIAPGLGEGERFACITHSTGGPVMRLWWDLFYEQGNAPCPMSHLIMLAPANFGSALAQLGKSRLSRLKFAVFDKVKPGTGVLDWLELGIRLNARPGEGFAHYAQAELETTVENLKPFLAADQTTLVEIELKRLVRRGTFELEQMTDPWRPHDFRKQKPGPTIT
jgi:hypothetical protein